MTSQEGAKRKAANYPSSEVVDLVDDSDKEDEGIHPLLGREVIDLVDDSDDAPPVLTASNHEPKYAKSCYRRRKW
jgi:hypothetical protein